MPTTPNVDNVKLGAAGVLWGTDDLGYTKGGIDVAIATSSKEVTVDQFGESVINEYITGRTVEVTVPMAESDLEKLILCIPGATLTGTNMTTKRKLVVKTGQGISLRSIARKLVLHPTGVVSTNKNDDFVVMNAAPLANIEFAYNFDNERVFKVTFKGFPDNTSGELFTFGDETATGV